MTSSVYILRGTCCRVWVVVPLILAIVTGCVSTSESRRPSVPECASSAVEAYQSGRFACAEQMLPAVKNPATRAELRGYMALRAGRLQEGLSALRLAIRILESRGSDYSDRHARQTKRLQRVYRLFLKAHHHVGGTQDSTIAKRDSGGTFQEK